MIEKFRIIHAIDSLGVGGGQVMLFELYRAIERYHLDIGQTVILLDKHQIDETFAKSYNVPYYPVDRAVLTRTIYDYQEPLVFVYHKLLSSHTDFYKKILRIAPVIVINHTFTESRSYNHIEPCDVVVAVSHNMVEFLKSAIMRQKHAVIHNGVNFDRYQPIVAIERDESDRKCLITGRINNLNNIKYSDKWLQWTMDVKLPFKMIHEYIGHGIHSRPAKNLVAENKKRARNEVRLLGEINDFEEKMRIVKSWDLFLYEINQEEGVSMAILEALASGVPVVCSNHAGNKEIIENGVNGYVFETKPEAKEILTELGLNRDILQDLQKSTLEHFQNKLDSRIQAAKYVDLFRKYVNKEREPLKINVTVHKNTISQREVLTNFQPVRKKVRPKKKIKDKQGKKIKKVEFPKGEIVINSSNDPNQEQKNKFTILTSAHNTAQFVDDWAKSILKQKYRPLEVIYVDDASSDNLMLKMPDIYKRFVDADIELKVIRNEKRLHCGSSYEVARRNATGNFYGVVDSDDSLVDDAVEFVVNVYLRNSKITWLYTQFNICDKRMKIKKKGFSRPPRKGNDTLLSMGERRKHAFSHWRTYSDRFPRPDKIFKKGLRCSVDKYMGYRLEEFGVGGFIDRICYNYREGSSPKNISGTEPTRKTWKKITEEAAKRRKIYKLKAHPILQLS